MSSKINKFVILFSVISLYQICIVSSLNILGIVTSTAKSNHIFSSAIFQILYDSGHTVKVLSLYDHSDSIDHIPLMTRNEIIEQNGIDHHENKGSYSNIMEYENGFDRTKATAHYDNFKKLLTSQPTVDIVILDFDYNEALIGLGAVFDCPVIVLMKSDVKGLLNIPNTFDAVKMSWLEKIIDLVYSLYERFYIDVFYYRNQAQLFDLIFNNYTKLSLPEVLDKHMTYIFISTIQKPFVMIADNVDVTCVHLRKNNNFFKYWKAIIPETLEEFITKSSSSSSNSLIYVSFGDELDPNYILTKSQISLIGGVLAKRPELIIWNDNDLRLTETILSESDKFYIDKSLPQYQILGRNEMKLFIMNGDHLSLIEAIAHQVPILCIPLTAEQYRECIGIERQEFGLMIRLDELTDDLLAETINQIFSSSKYRKNLNFKSVELFERPIALDEVLHFWTTQTAERELKTQKHHKIEHVFIINNKFVTYFCIFIIILICIISLMILMCKYCYLLVESILRITFTKKKVKFY